LSLPAGEVVGQPIRQTRQAEVCEHRKGLSGARGFSVERQLKSYVFQQRKEREQVVGLINETDVAASKVTTITLRHF
jgi:hypothetical protein